MAQIDLASIDIAPFIDGDAQARRSVGQSFARALETSGFAVIVGHGVPEALAQDTYGALKTFFAGSTDEKLAYAMPEKTKSRGYLPMGIESVAKTLSGETPPDLCEALVFRSPHRRGPAAPANIWPDQSPHLRPLIEAWATAMATLNAQLWRLAGTALDLPDDYFTSWLNDPSIALRFVHYPDQPTPPAPGQLRYGAHHDYGGLTILRQDNAPGGLQIRDTDGAWKEAGVVPNSFVINVGDLLARWTNDRWHSTLHRVSNPDRSLTGSTARLSMVAFTAPNETSEITCLPTCTDAANPPRYGPVRSGDYILAKLTQSMELTPAT